MTAATTGTPPPNPVRALDRLVGTWTLSDHPDDPPGTLTGQVRYEWMEGGNFLVQHVDMVHAGSRHKGVEYIGHDPGEGVLRSHYYDTTGVRLDYVYELDGDALTIWGGHVGSDASYRGTISADDATQIGRWSWPGGGYGAVATRLGHRHEH